MISVDKNVPMPQRTAGIRGMSKYPFMQMEIGDSFAVPAGKTHTVRQILYHNQKRTGRRYTTRLQNGEFRIWRVA